MRSLFPVRILNQQTLHGSNLSIRNGKCYPIGVVNAGRILRKILFLVADETGQIMGSMIPQASQSYQRCPSEPIQSYVLKRRACISAILLSRTAKQDRDRYGSWQLHSQASCRWLLSSNTYEEALSVISVPDVALASNCSATAFV